jgi:hypothetical protein
VSNLISPRMYALVDIGVQHSGVGKPRGDTLDAIIEWKIGNPRYKQFNQEQEQEQVMPQRQFTIELRVDYADEEKNAIMNTQLARQARHLLATATLLSDGQTPTIAAFSEDFFIGKAEIDLMLDAIGEGVKDMKPGEDSVSQELLDAFKAQPKSA